MRSRKLWSASLLVGLLGCVTNGCATNAPRPVASSPPSPVGAPSPTSLPANPLDDPAAPVEVVARAVVAQRQMKDRAFKEDEDSPVPADQRATFTGLAYFPFDAKYRFVATLEPCPQPEVIETETTRPDDTRRYRCAGVFRFTVDGVACRLVALTPDLGVSDAATDLFIPFRDTTAGTQTYPAGRYLQLKRRGDNAYVLDFNQAFNPYCAYGGNYSCPLPPPENHLTVAIRAGEMRWK